MTNTDDRKALRDYIVKSTSAATSCIIKPNIAANNTCQLEEDPMKIQTNISSAS